MTLTLNPLSGPSQAYSPKVANAAGVVQPGFDTEPVIVAEGLGGVALARETGGNLDAIVATLGTDGATPPAMPGGATGVRGWLRYIGQLLSGTLTVGGTVAVSNLPATQQVGGAVAVSNLPAVQPVSLAVLPLPAGAAAEATLAGLKAAVQAQLDLASTLWTDGSGAYYVRRDVVNEATGAITVAFVDPQGNAAAPGAGLKPAATSNTRTVLQTLYDATAAGPGIAVGDVIGRVAVVDTAASPPALVAVTWLNLTAGAVLGAAPAAGSIAEQTQHVAIANLPATQAVSAAALPLPTGAATEAGLEALNGSLATLAKDATLQAVKTALAGTLAVSAGALPLPAGAATDATLQAIETAIQAPLPAGSVVALGGANFLPSAKAPVTGTFTAAGQSAAFAPLADRNFNVSLWGTFAAAVQLERSFDAGTTWLPISAAGMQLFAFTAPASELREGEHEAGVLYRLNCTAFTSGTINYRVSQ